MFANKLRNSEFIKSVSILMTGTVIAQAVSYSFYPFITRLYSPEEMGDLGVFIRVVSFISILATLRYEYTFPIIKNLQQAFLLYRSTLRIAVIVCLSSFVFGICYVLLFSSSHINVLLILVTSITAFTAAWINSGTLWAIRMKLFKQISFQKISNSLAVNTLRYIFGIFAFGSFGLIIATCLGYIISSVTFIRVFLKENLKYQKYISKKKTMVLLKNHKEFPLVNLPHSALEIGNDLLVAMLILYHYDKEHFGFYSFAYLMLRLPLMIIGQSFGQVFFSRCSDLINNKKVILPFFQKNAFYLLVIGSLPFTILYFFGPTLFGFIFGNRWFFSGEVASIFSIAMFVNFIVSPLSTISLVLSRQKEVFFLGLIVVLSQLFVFGVIPILINIEFLNLLWINTTVLSILYLVAYFYYISFIRKYEHGLII